MKTLFYVAFIFASWDKKDTLPAYSFVNMEQPSIT